MDHEYIVNRPTLFAFLFNPAKLVMRHPGIVFHEHGRNGVAIVVAAHGADKHRVSTDLCHGQGLPCNEFSQLGKRVERNRGQLDRHRYPPVTDGKNATSSPSATGVADVA